jgi:hypothetical protein
LPVSTDRVGPGTQQSPLAEFRPRFRGNVRAAFPRKRPRDSAVSAGHGEGAAESVEVFGRDDLGAVAVVADGDPRGAGVEAFNFPLAAEVGHDRGELAGVIPMLQEFPQRGHSLSNEDDRGRGRGAAAAPCSRGRSC